MFVYVLLLFVHGQVSVGSGYMLLHAIFLHQWLQPGMLVPLSLSAWHVISVL